MIRTQIQLPENVVARLRRMADEEHASLAEMIRRAIACFFASSAAQRAQQRHARAAAAAGTCASGRGDLSTEHDGHFAEASRT